ncbi:MAG: spermine/spermidine synthase domain-containing protein, partial [Planctomycetota bacterium]
GLFLLSLALLFSLFGARAAPLELSPLQGVSPTFPTMLLFALGLLAPFCLIAGALFPLLLKDPEGKDLPSSLGYALESGGFLLGGCVSAFLLIPLLSNFAGFLAVAVATSAAAAFTSRHTPTRWIGGSASLLILVFALLPLSHRVDGALRSLRFPGETLALARDGPLGTVTVTEKQDLFTFREMGGWVGDTGAKPGAEEFVHLVLLSHPEPKSVALLGGGAIGELAEALKHGGEVHLAAANAGFLEAVLPFLPDQDREALAGARVHRTGGRAFLSKAARAGRRFDAVLVPVGDPTTGFLNRYYTSEFFSEVSRILAPGGLLGIHLSASPGYQSPARVRLFASVHRSLREAFPEVRVHETDHAGFVLLASAEPPAVDGPILVGRAEARGLKTSFVNPFWFASRYSRMDPPGLLDAAAETNAPANRDLRPASYLLAFSLWRSRFGTGLVFEAVFLLLPLLTVLVVAGFAGNGGDGRRQRRGLVLASAAVGLAGMAFEVGLLLAFQSKVGAVYTYLGALAAAFMAGAALGAWRARGALRPARRGRFLAASFGLFGLLAFLLLPLTATVLSLPAALALFTVLQLAAGGLTGAFFPQILALYRDGESAEGAGVLYGADLAGAAWGAILAGAIGVPVLGIPWTLFVAGGVGALGAAFLPWHEV